MWHFVDHPPRVSRIILMVPSTIESTRTLVWESLAQNVFFSSGSSGYVSNFGPCLEIQFLSIIVFIVKVILDKIDFLRN